MQIPTKLVPKETASQRALASVEKKVEDPPDEEAARLLNLHEVTCDSKKSS